MPRGGPDGGDGGNGGDIILEADEGLTTLAHFRYRKVFKAESGGAGSGRHRHGANGKVLLLKVPVGTLVQVRSVDVTYDLDRKGTRIVIARGGEGGRGNARFANSIRQAPNFSERGLPGEYLEVELELKLLADVGVVGLPNVGKSTLLRAVSRAMPDVGAFPFTTLEPVLGVVDLGFDAFVMADLPGLIEGAHAGVGLGHQFLRHVERTRVLVHLIDAGSDDPTAKYETVRRELELYEGSLAMKPEVVVFNKIDLPRARERAETLRASFAGRDVLLISGATKEGTQQLLRTLQRLLQTIPSAPDSEAAPEPPILRPEARDRLDVSQEESVYVVHGRRAEIAALKLGAGGYEALDELQERLRRLGLEKAMRRAGARPGDPMRIGAVELEWQG